KYIAAYYNRGNAYIKITKAKLAIKDLSKALELDEDFYQAYYNRGTVYKQLGKDDLAQKDLAKAKSLAQAELEQQE
ncbi:MAG: tetratricopeptide repeat protein, partial [Gammaproteobacteria bacterium]